MQILIVDGNLASSQIIIFDAGVMSLGHYWIITSFILIATDAIISHFHHKIKMNQATFNLQEPIKWNLHSGYWWIHSFEQNF